MARNASPVPSAAANLERPDLWCRAGQTTRGHPAFRTAEGHRPQRVKDFNCVKIIPTRHVRCDAASVGRAPSGKRIAALWLLTTLLGALPCSTVAAATNAAASTPSPTNLCPQFTLQDQFGSTHEFKFPRTKATVLTVADKRGSEDIKAWVHPLAVEFGDQIEIAGLADVSTVPGLLRSMVKSQFKKAITFPVMLDWDGGPTRSLNYIKGEANVYLIAPAGGVLHHYSGKVTPDKLNVLEADVREQLQTSSQANARSN
jgi:hypothetical protein